MGILLGQDGGDRECERSVGGSYGADHLLLGQTVCLACDHLIPSVIYVCSTASIVFIFLNNKGNTD